MHVRSVPSDGDTSIETTPAFTSLSRKRRVRDMLHPNLRARPRPVDTICPRRGRMPAGPSAKAHDTRIYRHASASGKHSVLRNISSSRRRGTIICPPLCGSFKISISLFIKKTIKKTVSRPDSRAAASGFRSATQMSVNHPTRCCQTSPDASRKKIFLKKSS